MCLARAPTEQDESSVGQTDEDRMRQAIGRGVHGAPSRLASSVGRSRGRAG